MSKRKKAHFRLQKGETLLKKGMMDYCMTGGYGHAAMGDAYLTDARFFFGAELKSSREYLSFEIPLNDIYEVKKTGIPILTRSILIVADGREYRFNVFPMRGWISAIGKAVTDARGKQRNP